MFKVNAHGQGIDSWVGAWRSLSHWNWPALRPGESLDAPVDKKCARLMHGPCPGHQTDPTGGEDPPEVDVGQSPGI